MPSARHVIISTASGTGQAELFYKTHLTDSLNTLGWKKGQDFTVHFTQSESTVTNITKHVFLPAANSGVTLSIILLSGDGGIVDVINAILSSSRAPQYACPEITLLPLGTGNALATSLGIPTENNSKHLTALLQARPHPLPTIRATFSPGARLLTQQGSREVELFEQNGIPTLWGAVVCSWAMHASLVADSDTPEYRKHGAQRFQMAAKAALYPSDGSSSHRYSGRVTVLKNSVWRELDCQKHGYVLATLVSCLEKGFTISPTSRPLDGRLRLIHFGPMSGDEVMGIMTAAYDQGKHVEDERVRYEEIDGLRIVFDGDDEEDGRWRRICVDGKIIRIERGGWLEVVKEETHILNIVYDPEHV
jgi:diacylglycerol kinase family enzyme